MKKAYFFAPVLFATLLISCGSDDDGEINQDNGNVTVQFSQESGFDIEGDINSLPTLLLQGEVSSATTVTVELIANGTSAEEGSDFQFSSPEVINIPIGSYDGSANTALAISGLTIIDDLDEEETETIELILTNPTGNASLGNRDNTSYSILDNDGLSVSFLLTSATGTESSPNDLPRLLVIGPVLEDIVVTVTASEMGTATLGEDYNLQSPQEVVIPEGVYDGSSASTIAIPGLQIIDDDLIEETEFFELSLSSDVEDLLRFTETRYNIEGIAPCEGGIAGNFPCNGYDLLGRITVSDFESSAGNDIWGWTDPTNGDEYALVGLTDGTAFVDVSGDEPVYLGKLPSATGSSIWRDIKVYENHAYIVSEATGHGMQVFNLAQLRNVNNPPTTFTETARYTGIGNSHNIVINEEVGYAYPVGTARTDAFSGGVHFVDIQNPSAPTAAGGYGTNGYCHDAQVVTYIGPDTDYLGREIFIGSNETQIAIVDITDKSNPTEIATLDYSQVGYTHQGWFTEDQRYFLLGDELDEINFGFNSRTLVFDFSDLDNPAFHMNYTGPTGAIDHNGYVKGNEFFLANYTAGMRVLDISDIANRNINEIAFFDTFPNNDVASFDGAWSVYPYFESGKIIINDSNTGFFVVRKSE